MPITSDDIKLLESERMTDTTDGGGRRTSNVIADGVAGNIMPKVSRLDGVYGRVNLRKVYSHVDTPDTDVYAGAHAVILDAADDERINVCLFSTGSDFDTRTQARDRIESYVIAGPESRMVLYGRQLVGQQAVTVLQRVEDVLPEVGEVYDLSKETAGVVNYQQFIRVENVDHEVRTFTDAFGDFTRRIVTLTISAPLRYEFVGQELVSRMSAVARSSLVRETSVADASRYFGIKPVTEAAETGALELTVSSIFAPIVPTNQREAPISNAEIAGGSQAQAAGTVNLPYRRIGDTFSTVGFQNKVQTLNVGGAIKPGSLKVYLATNAGDSPGPVTTDDGAGTIPNSGGSFGRIVNGGTVNYTDGVIVVDATWGDGSFQGRLWLSYMPATEVSQPAHQKELPVTLATRGTVQVLTLNPLPAKGTAYVDFRAQGRWYRLRDDGTGALVGADPLYGTGTVDPLTGSLIATLGALPDVGSSILVGWASPAHYAIRAGGTSDADSAVRQTIQLAHLPVKPGTLTVEYVAGSTTYTGTADASGNITGGGITGTVNHATGEVKVAYSTRMPNMETAVTVAYDQEVPADPDAPTSASGTEPFVSWVDPTFDTAPNVANGGLRVRIPVLIPPLGSNPATTIFLDANDDGAGNLKTLFTLFNASGSSWSHAGGTTVGSVNYSTGVVTLDNDADIPLVRDRFVAFSSPGDPVWIPYDRDYHMVFGDYNWTARLDNPSTALPQEEVFDDVPFTLDLTSTVKSAVVPGSVYFTAFGLTYYDRSGTIFNDIQPDGTGTEAGTIDYSTGKVTLTDWTENTGLNLTVYGCLTKFGDFTAVKASFRTAGSPLRPASTFVQVVSADGETLTATSDVGGDLSGTFARGTVNQQMGVVSIEWGEMVLAAGNEGEEWYDPANVVGANVWKPREVMPGTIRYNTVVLSNLPVNADILGLDPVRLPSDGRVPIFRAADVVLIHNTKSTVLPNPAVAGATYSVGRTNVAEIVLRDVNGLKVPTSKYSVDLSAGEVTMADPLDLTGYAQPLTARDRIEELNLASDVQINGQISLAAPLSRDFDEDTLVSSALLIGDMFARVTNVFDEATFLGWSDTRLGSNATAEYDTINHPIEVLNSGAVTERWRINFTSGAAFQVIGENLGVIATGTTGADCSPINPLTGEAYFVLRAAGWGLGWSVGNNLRFNTLGASAPIWMARTVLPGATLAGDSVDLQVRGDVDA